MVEVITVMMCTGLLLMLLAGIAGIAYLLHIAMKK